MNKRRIEDEAISAFEVLIRNTPYLIPYINKNDKTPLWDGDVFVYSQEDTDMNKYLIGKVPVQVKGHYTNDIFPKKIKFNIKKVSLRSYRDDGGVFYVVVYINYNDGACKTKIFYEQLLPSYIENILSCIGNKESKSIELNEVPQRGLEDIFLNFIKDRKIQYSTFNVNKLYLANKPKENELEFEILSFRKGNSIIDLMTNTSFYLYEKVNAYNIKIPNMRVSNAIVTSRKIHEIGVGSKIYYTADTTNTIYKKNETIIKFGANMCLIIASSESGDNISFNFGLKGSLRLRIYDAEFLLAAYQNMSISVNGKLLTFKDTVISNKIYEIKDILEKYKKIENKLKNLNVYQDFYIDKLDKNNNHLVDLLMMVNENKAIKQSIKLFQPYLFDIVNIKLIVFAALKENEIYLHDFFYNNIHLSYNTYSEEGVEYEVSRYLGLVESSLCASNVNAELIYSDIVKYDTWENYMNMVNIFLLECLKAYDSKKGISSELLSLSLLLIEWLLKKDSNSIYFKLNNWQIKARMHTLSEQDTKEIQKMYADENLSWDIRCGVYILCGKYEEAEELLGKQVDIHRDEFKSFPIYSLAKRKEDSV